jgi:hypothetical protein
MPSCCRVDHLHLGYYTSLTKSRRSWSRHRSPRASLGPSCRDHPSSSTVAHPCTCSCALTTTQSVLAVLAQLVLVAVLVLRLLWLVCDEVSWLAALKAHLCCLPCVHPILVQHLELSGQQCLLVFSKHVELLIWRIHQRRQRVHPRGCVGVRHSHFATDESETMGVSRAVKMGCQTTINLSRLELRERLVHHQSGVLFRLKDGLDLSIPHGTT